MTSEGEIVVGSEAVQQVARRLAQAEMKLTELRPHLEKIIEDAAAAREHRTAIADVADSSEQLVGEMRKANTDMASALVQVIGALELAKRSITEFEAQAAAHSPEHLEAVIRDRVGILAEELLSDVRGRLEPLSRATEDVSKLGAQLVDLSPARLLAELDERARQLDDFRVRMEPLKTKVDELIAAVGGSGRRRELVERVDRLHATIKLQTVFLVIVVVAVLLPLFLSG